MLETVQAWPDPDLVRIDPEPIPNIIDFVVRRSAQPSRPVPAPGHAPQDHLPPGPPLHASSTTRSSTSGPGTSRRPATTASRPTCSSASRSTRPRAAQLVPGGRRRDRATRREGPPRCALRRVRLLALPRCRLRGEDVLRGPAGLLRHRPRQAPLRAWSSAASSARPRPTCGADLVARRPGRALLRSPTSARRSPSR